MRQTSQEDTSISALPLGPYCPWQSLGFAPGLLALILQQGRVWQREHELAREAFELLGTLTRSRHALLRHLVEIAVEEGFCPAAEGLLLLVGTAPDDDCLAAALTAGDGSWVQKARYGCGAAGMDHPGLEARVSGWPLHEAFRNEAPPPEWDAWGRLAIGGTLGAAARKVLGSLFRRSLSAPAAPAPAEAES